MVKSVKGTPINTNTARLERTKEESPKDRSTRKEKLSEAPVKAKAEVTDTEVDSKESNMKGRLDTAKKKKEDSSDSGSEEGEETEGSSFQNRLKRSFD